MNRSVRQILFDCKFKYFNSVGELRLRYGTGSAINLYQKLALFISLFLTTYLTLPCGIHKMVEFSEIDYVID